MEPLFSDALLIRSFLILLLMGSVAGLLAGISMLLQPLWLQRAANFSNRWISTRQITRPFVKIFNLDSWFYRYNRLSGAVILAGSVYIIYYFTGKFDAQTVLKNVFHVSMIPLPMREGLLDALVLASLSGAVFALLVSFFLILRPSMLRDFEIHANRKTSLRQTMKPFEIQRNGLERWIFKHMRIAGILLTAGSFYTLLVLLNYLKFA